MSTSTAAYGGDSTALEQLRALQQRKAAQLDHIQALTREFSSWRTTFSAEMGAARKDLRSMRESLQAESVQQRTEFAEMQDELQEQLQDLMSVNMSAFPALGGGGGGAARSALPEGVPLAALQRAAAPAAEAQRPAAAAPAQAARPAVQQQAPPPQQQQQRPQRRAVQAAPARPATPPMPEGSEASSCETDPEEEPAAARADSPIQSDSDGDEDEDEDDDFDMDDGAPFARPTLEGAPPGFQQRRRFSVSSEGMKAAQADAATSDLARSVEAKSALSEMLISSAIAGNILFSEMDASEAKRVLDALFAVEVVLGDDITKQGEEGDNFYILESGTCEVLISKGGVDASVHNYSAGASFGELALMYNCPRAATVRATSRCKLWAMDRSSFRAILMSTGSKTRSLYESFLESVPLFSGMRKDERVKIADVLRPMDFADGDEILTQGDVGDSMFILEKGSAKATLATKSGKEIVVKRYEPGHYFGELALLSSTPRAANVLAVGEVRGNSCIVCTLLSTCANTLYLLSQVTCLIITREQFDRLLGPCVEILERDTTEYARYAEQIE